jgi:uncharacterized protein YjeT (DUF2065 family)
MAIGIAMTLGGLFLALAPIAAARAANALRFVPHSKDPGRVREYRVAGGLIAAIGIVLIITL